MKPAFVHLHLHSEYSIVDGIVRVKKLVKAVQDMDMPVVAVTDAGNLFATVKLFKAAFAAGVKPILGADIWLGADDEESPPSKLVLLCQNTLGYKNLTKIISKGYTDGQHQGRPIIKKAWLEQHAAGLIALSAGRVGDIGQALLNGNTELARACLKFWQQLFPQRFYLELQRTGRIGEEDYIHAAIQLSSEHQVPVVATNDVRFIDADDFEAHEARVCIHDGYTLGDQRRQKIYSEQQFLRSADEMIELFTDIPEAIANTIEIAKRCNFDLELGKTYLPDFPVPTGMTIETFLQHESEQGLNKRLAILQITDRKKYDERLAIELKVINDMGFPGYFLIVADFIRWAKENGVPVGPGRGSGAGSLVAYVLDITDLDPLEFDLLFERFLNPERVSMPDFDIDFCMEGRDRVIDYVANKYGRDSVSQIITYGTMAAKAVVRDVGRVLGHPYGFIDTIAKLIPFEIGITLDKALEIEEDLAKRYRFEPEVRDLINLAKKLEGVARNAGKHAGGVVIAPSHLTDFAPLYCEADGSNLVTQFDKDDVEAVGLVKFDFLGLRTLTIIDWAVRTANLRREEPIDITLIPRDDLKTFKLLQDNATTAVFQLESRGMKDLIKRQQPDRFEDIIALVALFRPGPLQSGMVDDFIDRKHGRAEVVYPHPDLEPILSPTYGVILYQEQVMQIAQVLANYSLGAADMLRRAMGKKKPEEMAKQRNIFTSGAVARGVDEETATYIFDLMEKFAGYGFNKSHSAAYALLAYQTAWLKTHEPAAFMAAVLSSDMDNTEKVVTFIEEVRHMGLKLIPADINSGEYKFTVNDDNEILYGIGAVKGVGEAAIALMLNERDANGPYKHLFDFCQRVDLSKVNRRVLEALVRAGVMDQLGPNRATLFLSIEKAVKMASKQNSDSARGQNDLFGEIINTDEPDYIIRQPWSDEERLKGEKDTLGFYLSGHPLDRYREELRQLKVARIVDLKPSYAQTVKIVGLVVSVRTMITKRGKRMAFLALDDNSSRMELAIFADSYEEHKSLLIKDNLLYVEGEVSIDDYSGGYKMSAKHISSLEKACTNVVRRLRMRVHKDNMPANFMDQLMEILRPYQNGECPVCIEYDQGDATAQVLLGPQWRVKPVAGLLKTLHDWLGKEQVVLDF